MRHRTRARMTITATTLALATFVFSRPAIGAEQVEVERGAELKKVEEPAGPNRGKISLTAGMDFATAYFFRGIFQESSGFIGQPYADVAINLYQGEKGLNSVDANVGIWNSIHSGPSGSGGSNADPTAWYEFDFYSGLTFGFLDTWEAGVTYTIYTSPNGFFKSTQEIALSFAFDDSDLLGDFALSPHVVFAFEFQGGGADGQRPLGTYFELGVEPSLVVIESEKYPVTLAVPLTLGLSLSDYYQDPNTGQDSTFGYFDGGLVFSVPLGFMPADYGAWEVFAGVHFLALGSSTKALNMGDSFQAIGQFGIAMSY